MAVPIPLEVDIDRAHLWLAHGATLLDVREKAEREWRRIPDSLWIPITELTQRWRELPTGVPVIVYCSAGSRSFRASKYLREQGRPAAAMVGGISAWMSRGDLIESGPPVGARPS